MEAKIIVKTIIGCDTDGIAVGVDKVELMPLPDANMPSAWNIQFLVDAYVDTLEESGEFVEEDWDFGGEASCTVRTPKEWVSYSARSISL